MPHNVARRDQVLSSTSPTISESCSLSADVNSSTTSQSSKVAPKIAPNTPNGDHHQSKEESAMEEESIAIVSTDASDASSISSLSGGSCSTSSSSSSLLTTATSNNNNAGNVNNDDNRDNTYFPTSVENADIDKTPVSYELSLSMYHGLLESCRPFYFPSERQLAHSSNATNKIAPRLEDALKRQKETAAHHSVASAYRKRASPVHHLDDNEKYGGRKVRVKTISFQVEEPSVHVSRKKAKRYHHK